MSSDEEYLSNSSSDEENKYQKSSTRQSFKHDFRKPYDDIDDIKARRYAEDDVTFSRVQIALMVSLTILMGYVIYEYEYVHICAVRFYANLGDKDAQHILGQRYYLGKGVERNKSTAFYWFKEAAKQGHPHASYNLGVAHIQGFHRLERKGEAHDLLRHAASVGVVEAVHVLQTACARGECDR